MAKQKDSKSSNNDFIRDPKAAEPQKITAEQVKNIALLKNEQARRITGFLLAVLAVVMCISFISFFFSWKSDQDLIAGSESGQDHASNALGLLGAKLGFWFVHSGFGLAAFALLPLIFLTGMYLLAGWRPFSLLRLAIHTLLFTAWFSLLLGYSLQKWYPAIGGGFGYFGVQQLQDAIGGIGVFIFLAVYATLYTMLFLNLNPFARLPIPKPKDLSNVSPSPESASVNISAETPQNAEEPLVEIDEDIELPEIEEKPNPITQIFLKTKEPENNPKHEPHIFEEVPKNHTHEFDLAAESLPQKKIISTDSDFEIEVQEDEPEAEIIGGLQSNLPEHYGLDTSYDPTLDLRDYKYPTMDLLTEYSSQKREIDTAELETSKNMIIETLKNYNIAISKIKASVGPTVTLYEIVPAPGVKISKIKNLEDDIALSLAALGIRIIAPIPGKGTIGIEVPNKNPEMVPMRGVLASKKFQENDFQLPVVLGKTISNEIFVADLAKMPHLLMAGATGQGKSVGLNAILVSLLYKKHPAHVKFVLVDPKKVELTLYNKIERHFLAKLPGDGEAIITDNTKVINTLNSLCVEMDNRYKLLQDAMVRNIVEYNAKFVDRKLNPQNGHKFLPYIVVVIDEVADLMMTAGKEIETPIARIAQLARAIGIHLILATQRPSVNVITGMIKANFPARIAFRVTSKIDSRTILDGNGADQLIGKGDLLYSGGNDMIRLQCPFVDTPEVEKITEFIGSQRAYASAYLLPEVKEESGTGGNEAFDPDERDALFEDAARVVVLNQVGSTSMIQRKLKIGYNRAGRLIDQLEHAGIVGPFEGSKARQVLIPDEYSLEQFLNNLGKD